MKKVKVIKYQGVEYPEGYVIARCPKCKQDKVYDMSKPLDHMPMCSPKCFMPVFVRKVVVPVQG
jgi:hypothetical protein